MPDHLTRLPAVTLHEPWATLIAIGAKKIETRPRRAPAHHLGRRIAIHAGRHPVPFGETIGEWTVRVHEWIDGSPGGNRRIIRLNRGHVVATAHLVASVPMIDADTDARWPSEGQAICVRDGAPTGFLRPGGWPWDLTSEAPYGLWTPGRWAWLLGDVRPLPTPILRRGRQGWWTVELPWDNHKLGT